jgi:hypothetical protein
MHKVIRVFVVLCTILVAPLAAAENFQVDLDASYVVANPDYSPFESGEGASIQGLLVYRGSLLLVARYNDASFRPSGPVAGGMVESWSEIGLGYRAALSTAWDSELVVTSQHVDNTRGSESGFQVQVGARFKAREALSFALHVGYLDVLIDDWTLNLESKYRFHPHAYAVARLRDYADWDFTYYELGLGVSF